MDKNTLGNYGWVVITVIIISIMIALASPFAVALKGNVVGVTNDFTGRLDAALNSVDNNSENSKEEGPQLNEYGFYYGQPYRGVMDGIETEMIFFENNSMIAIQGDEGWYTSSEENAVTYSLSGIELSGVLISVSDNGTILTNDIMGLQLILEEVSQKPIQKKQNI